MEDLYWVTLSILHHHTSAISSDTNSHCSASSTLKIFSITEPKEDYLEAEHFLPCGSVCGQLQGVPWSASGTIPGRVLLEQRGREGEVARAMYL